MIRYPESIGGEGPNWWFGKKGNPPAVFRSYRMDTTGQYFILKPDGDVMVGPAGIFYFSTPNAALNVLRKCSQEAV